MKYQPVETKQVMHYLPILKDRRLRLNQNFLKVTAHFEWKLSKNELKAWYVLLSEITSEYLTKHSTEQQKYYSFDALSFADRLGIDKRRPRGKDIAKLFVGLSEHCLNVESEQDGLFYSTMISEVVYNPQTHILYLALSDTLKRMLMALSQQDCFSLDVNSLLSLQTTKAIRIFVYLKNLQHLGLNEISIEEFFHELHLTSSEQEYKYLKRNTLLPAMKEIQTNTPYEKFFIVDDGKKGRKATKLFFGFHLNQPRQTDLFLPEKMAHSFLIEDVGLELAQNLSEKFSERVLIAIHFAVQKGFHPKYIAKHFDGLSEEQIINNLNYVQDIIVKDKRKGQEKDPITYGKYFLKAVTDNWIMKQFALPESKQTSATLQDKHDLAPSIQMAYQKAEKYLSSLSLNELTLFVKQNLKQLQENSGGKEFVFEKACSRKKTYREYKLVIKLMTGKILTGEILVPTISLFEG